MPSCSQFILKHEESFYGLCSTIVRFFVDSSSSEGGLEKRWISAEWRPGLGTFIDDRLFLPPKNIWATCRAGASSASASRLNSSHQGWQWQRHSSGLPASLLLCCPEHFLLGTGTLFQSPQLLMNERNRSMAFDTGWLLKPASLMVRWSGSEVPDMGPNFDSAFYTFQSWANDLFSLGLSFLIYTRTLSISYRPSSCED